MPNFAPMHSSPAPKSPSMVPVLLTAFLDMVGIGIIVPVVAPLVISNTTGMFEGVDEQTRKMIYGLLVASFPIAQFFGAPLFGAASDKYGRKPMLALGLVGAAIAYAGFAYGIEAGLVWLIFAARTLAGFCSGTLSIVYSSVAELSKPEVRARNFGLIGMMAGMGFILGPALGGVLVNEKLVSWFGPSIPFWTSGLLCVANLVILQLFMHETLQNKGKGSLDPLSGFKNIVKAFQMEGMTALFVVVCLSTLGFAFFTQFFNVYMIKRFAFEDEDLAWIFGFIGVCIAIVSGGLMRPVTKVFQPQQILRVTYFALGAALASMVLLKEVWMIYALIPMVAITHGLSFPNLSSLISTRAPAAQQGEIMGINQSLGALGNSIPPIVAGLISGVDDRLPLLTAGGVTLLAGLVFTMIYRAGKLK